MIEKEKKKRARPAKKDAPAAKPKPEGKPEGWKETHQPGVLGVAMMAWPTPPKAPTASELLRSLQADARSVFDRATRLMELQHTAGTELLAKVAADLSLCASGLKPSAPTTPPHCTATVNVGI